MDQKCSIFELIKFFLSACDCHPSGTVEESYCDIQTGVCLCIDNVEGDDCSQCSQGYWNIGEGCVACNCTSNAISCDQVKVSIILL